MKLPAVEGWFTMDDADPRLLGNRCRTCGTYFFPRTSMFCRNPHCEGTEFDEVPLSRRGRVWSVTTNRYQPPAPYVSPEPFEPYKIDIGTEVELVLDTLYREDENEYVVWKWSPV